MSTWEQKGLHTVTGWRQWVTGAAALAVCLTVGAAPAAAARGRAGDHPKLDRKLNDRAAQGDAHLSRVIVILKPGVDATDDFRKVGGRLGRRLGLVSGQVVELTNNQLRRLADSPLVESIHWDRPLNAHLNRAGVSTGARAVQALMGYDGAGVGVAVIDSGITAWHDDLSYLGSNSSVRVVGGQRVAKFVDFVNGRTTPYDDNGHGTHVAGIIAGNGYDTCGEQRRHGAGGASGQPEGARRAAAAGTSATSSRRSTGPSRTRPRTTSASSTCRSAPR